MDGQRSSSLLFAAETGAIMKEVTFMTNMEFLNKIVIPEFEKWVNNELKQKGYVTETMMNEKFREMLETLEPNDSES
jgi:hypothetical protein